MEVKSHTSLYNLLSLCNRLAVCRCAVHGLSVVGMEVVVERPAHAMAIFSELLRGIVLALSVQVAEIRCDEINLS